jgi:hypothetical protein
MAQFLLGRVQNNRGEKGADGDGKLVKPNN